MTGYGKFNYKKDVKNTDVYEWWSQGEFGLLNHKHSLWKWEGGWSVSRVFAEVYYGAQPSFPTAEEAIMYHELV